jgi:hypothetical protein
MIPRHSLELLELRIAPAAVVLDAIDVAVDHSADLASAPLLEPDFSADDLVAAPLDTPPLTAGGFSLFDLAMDVPVTNALIANIASIIGVGVVHGASGGVLSSDLGIDSLAVAGLSADFTSLQPGAASQFDFGPGSVIVVEASGLTGASPEALLIVNL